MNSVPDRFLWAIEWSSTRCQFVDKNTDGPVINACLNSRSQRIVQLISYDAYSMLHAVCGILHEIYCIISALFHKTFSWDHDHPLEKLLVPYTREFRSKWTAFYQNEHNEPIQNQQALQIPIYQPIYFPVWYHDKQFFCHAKTKQIFHPQNENEFLCHEILKFVHLKD